MASRCPPSKVRPGEVRLRHRDGEADATGQATDDGADEILTVSGTATFTDVAVAQVDVISDDSGFRYSAAFYQLVQLATRAGDRACRSQRPRQGDRRAAPPMQPARSCSRRRKRCSGPVPPPLLTIPPLKRPPTLWPNSRWRNARTLSSHKPADLQGPYCRGLRCQRHPTARSMAHWPAATAAPRTGITQRGPRSAADAAVAARPSGKSGGSCGVSRKRRATSPYPW